MNEPRAAPSRAALRELDTTLLGSPPAAPAPDARHDLALERAACAFERIAAALERLAALGEQDTRK